MFLGVPAGGEEFSLPWKIKSCGLHQGFVDWAGDNRVETAFQRATCRGFQRGKSTVSALGGGLARAGGPVVAQDFKGGSRVDPGGGEGEPYNLGPYSCWISHSDPNTDGRKVAWSHGIQAERGRRFDIWAWLLFGVARKAGARKRQRWGESPTDTEVIKKF